MRTTLVALVLSATALTLPEYSNAVSSTGPTGAALATAAAAMPKPLLGGWSRDATWYAASVGPVQIYRMYDLKFTWPTWNKTMAYRLHGNAQEDYSFNLPPADVAAGRDDAKLKTFIASTPKNIILTNYHEPEQEIAAGKFTAAQFRASIVRLATLVHAQNKIDGGTRRVSVILMYDTVYGFKGRNPMNYWPGRNPATGANYADLISFDTYALPHATGTPGIPAGFTDGLKWQSASQLLDPSIAFAAKIGSPWMISEFGYLEDINNPGRRAQALTDFANYARLHGAVAVEYWDSYGTRADWQLRYSTQASAAWKAIVNAP
jgi:hypothetical protein